MFKYCNKFLSNRFLYNFVKVTARKMSSNAPRKPCTIAVCQFTSSNDKEHNLQIVKRLINKAVAQNAQVIFLPEACDFIANNKNDVKTKSEGLNDHIMTQYKNIAKDNNVWLSIGGFHERNDEAQTGTFNSHILINSDGEITSIYRKVHLFDVCIPEKKIDLRESVISSGGKHILPPVQTPAGNLALAICYDLRFPEMSTLLRKMEAEILTFPSAFTQATGEAHWEVLLRARAIENQCYVVAAAQYGRHNEKRISYGHAMIIDPWGKILAECPKFTIPNSPESNESVAIATVDPIVINNTRQSMPVLNHRRTDLYNLSLIERKTKINDEQIFKFATKDILGSTVFYQTNLSFAFTNIRCVVPGHVLISSLRVVKRLEDLTVEEQRDLFLTTVDVQKVMEKKYNTDSSTICIQDGQFAGQTVSHVHVHILPRRQGDFDRNDDIYGCLANHDKDENSQPIRDIAEMVKEAQELRKYFY